MSCFFKVEFFPFSNYQMYSRSFLPKDSFKILKVSAIKNDERTDFKNNRFGLFISEQPLVESFDRNAQVKGKDYSKFFLESIYNFKNVQQVYDYLVLEQVNFDWVQYRSAALAGKDVDPKIFSTKTEVAKYGAVKN